MKFAVLPAFALLTVSQAFGFGFSRGNSFKSVVISGTLTISCPGTTANFRCRDLVLDPAPLDRFVGPANIPADSVVLTSKSDDGTTRTRTEAYDGKTGQSAPVNLWLSELFKRPLLVEGRNQISYRLLQGSREIGSGNFVLDVVPGQNRTCPSASFSSRDPDDCRSQYTLCHQYFEQAKYCK